jgi:acetolactate synthase-1/2/3 large subunit
MYTASMAMLEALTEAGVSYIFANFGSDHPALIEAIAEARATSRKIPRIVTCPNEMVALSAAHGFAQVSGVAQAVIVHVDCGTQALGGAVHNAARGRIPVFIYAGLSPSTQEGELTGSRNEFIHWLQDTADQRGIMRQYMKYENEFRTGANVKQIVHRAMQLAASDPKGPVYLVGSREVMEAASPETVVDIARWSPIGSVALTSEAVEAIAKEMAGAHRPLIVTSYVGRNPAAVAGLVRLCERLGVGVLESAPNTMNFPHSNPLYQGSHWNHPFQNAALAEADVVLVLDSDVPWMPSVSRPNPAATIFHVDLDPLKPSMPLWYIHAHGSFHADAHTALDQLNRHLDGQQIDTERAAARRAHYSRRHTERAVDLLKAESANGHIITPQFLTAAVRAQIGDEAIVLNEGITNYPAIFDHLARTKPGTMFTSGGSSLGWHGGAAIGAKLAAPDKTVVALTGDGSYMFSVPSTVHWMARRYGTPFLQVVYNNGGWQAPKFSALAVHPDGYASRAGDLDLSFAPAPDYAGIAAAAGNAYALRVDRPEDVESAIADALNVVRHQNRAAVVDVRLTPE